MLLDEFKIVEVAAIVLRDAQGRVLSVRKGSSPRFHMPGGYTAPRRFQCAGLKRAGLYGGFPRIHCRGSL